MSQRKWDYYTFNVARPPLEGVNVYGWSTYPSYSVLAGQPMKAFLKNYPDEASAQKDYPDAKFSNEFSEPQVNLSYLPGEENNVAGGNQPDDI